MFLFVWHDLNQAFRTGAHTASAGFTFLRIYYRNAVYHMNRIELTGFYTASKSETSEATSFRTAVLHLARHNTVFNSCIVIGLFYLAAGSGTFDKCSLTDRFSCVGSENCGNLFCYRSSSDRAAVMWCLTFRNGCRKS